MSKKLSRKLIRAKKPKFFKDLDSSTLLMTITEEFFQPARIYYDVYDQVALQNIFLDLKCMDYDDQKDRWVWNYTDEAKNIHFKRSWSELPKDTHPLVIGSLYAPKENQMYIDVNSFERVPAAVRFFSDRIDQKIAEVTHMQLYNKISRVRDGIPDHHQLFEEILSHRPDPDAEMHALITEAKESGNLEKLRDHIFKEQYEKSKHEIATIETMKIYYDIGHEEDCLETIQGGLRMRTAVALEHDRGNTDFTFNDFLNKAFNLNKND
jgi:hypothetical protein